MSKNVNPRPIYKTKFHSPPSPPFFENKKNFPLIKSYGTSPLSGDNDEIWKSTIKTINESFTLAQQAIDASFNAVNESINSLNKDIKIDLTFDDIKEKKSINTEKKKKSPKKENNSLLQVLSKEKSENKSEKEIKENSVKIIEQILKAFKLKRIKQFKIEKSVSQHYTLHILYRNWFFKLNWIHFLGTFFKDEVEIWKNVIDIFSNQDPEEYLKKYYASLKEVIYSKPISNKKDKSGGELSITGDNND